jgi:nitroreductase
MKKGRKRPKIKKKEVLTMDTLDAISGRISVRKYADFVMPKEDIETILKAGLEAPSAMNRRPYELIVNTDNAFWKEFLKAKPTAAILATSSLTIVVVGDSNKNPTNEFLVEDASCVSENMLLAARALGYGSLWAGVKWDSDFAKQLTHYFRLPDGYLPIAVLCFGKAAEKVSHDKDRFEQEKIHYGKF